MNDLFYMIFDNTEINSPRLVTNLFCTKDEMIPIVKDIIKSNKLSKDNVLVQPVPREIKGIRAKDFS